MKFNRLRFVRTLTVIGATLALSIAPIVFVPGCAGVKISKLYTHGALSTVCPIATSVGERIFAQGGNAADVAVAVGFALAVVYPPAGNIGGGGFALVRNGKTGEITSLDFRETAPAAATENMYLDASGNVIEGASTIGAKASGTPGSVAGLYALWKTFGSMPWDELIAPAILYADTGFVVDKELASKFAEDSANLALFPETGELFLPKGKLLQVGDTLIQRDLARTLKLIARDGPDAFYRGDIAAHLVDCMTQHGGLITTDDLASYAVQWREPLRFTFDSLQIVSMAPPSSGGTIVGQILKLIEPYDFSRWSPSSVQYIHIFCETARLAYADRATHLGDPSFYSVPGGLLDSSYLASRRKSIKDDQAGSSEETAAGDPTAHESANTTHFSVADSKGNIVSFTYTLNDIFGSALVVKGGGFLLNNEMDDFSIKPGTANLYGLVGGQANKIAPGKRMLSSMSPTIVLSHGQPALVLGTPGGSKIITAVAQAIVNYSRFHMSPEEIVSYPRFHHQWRPDSVFFERNAAVYSQETRDKLARMGYQISEKSPWCDLNIIEINGSGIMHPAADPRPNGSAGGY